MRYLLIILLFVGCADPSVTLPVHKDSVVIGDQGTTTPVFKVDTGKIDVSKIPSRPIATFKMTDSLFLHIWKDACNCSAYVGGLPSDTNGGSHFIEFDTCYCHHYDASDSSLFIASDSLILIP